VVSLPTPLRPNLGKVELVAKTVAPLLVLGSLALGRGLVSDELGLGLVEIRNAALVADVLVRCLLLHAQVAFATTCLEIGRFLRVAEDGLAGSRLGGGWGGFRYVGEELTCSAEDGHCFSVFWICFFLTRLEIRNE